jgi:ribokinase
VICVGHLMVDVIAALPGELARNSDTPAPVTVRHGGSAANTAAWVAAAGASVSFVGRVGADPFGAAAVGELRSAGVTPVVAMDENVPTGLCIVLVSPDGERTMIPSAGANARLAATDLPPIAAEQWVHVSGYSLFDEGSRGAAQAAMERAQAAGAMLSVDASSAALLDAFGGRAFLDRVPTTALVLANADEARVLTGCADPAAAAEALVRRFDRVVIKDGSRGATLAAGTGCVQVPARPAEPVDTTGAGDAFAGGLIAALAAGAELPVAVEAGHGAAAAAVATVGARPVR